MIPIKNTGARLWHDQIGQVLTTELVATATIAVVGLLVAMSTVRDAVTSEISDVAGSAQDLNQCYTYNSVTGHSATTAGSSFVDATDHCDDAEDPVGEADNCITMNVPPTNESEGSTSTTTRFEAEGDDVVTTTGGAYSEGWNLWSNGFISFKYDITEAGEYTFSAGLWATLGGPELANAAFHIGGVVVDDFDITQTSHATAGIYSVVADLAVGCYQFAIEFTNDFYNPPIDRNLLIDWMQIEGPN